MAGFKEMKKSSGDWANIRSASQPTRDTVLEKKCTDWQPRTPVLSCVRDALAHKSPLQLRVNGAEENGIYVCVWKGTQRTHCHIHVYDQGSRKWEHKEWTCWRIVRDKLQRRIRRRSRSRSFKMLFYACKLRERVHRTGYKASREDLKEASGWKSRSTQFELFNVNGERIYIILRIFSGEN